MNKWYNQIPKGDLEEYKSLMKKDPERPFRITKKTDFIVINIFEIENHNLKPFDDTFVYEMNSTMTFGKFKNCELKDVYKISPHYIEWCILNAEGFIIAPNTFELLQKESVFVLSDIMQYASEDITDHLTLDFSSFDTNPNGFLTSNNVNEQCFTFSEQSLIKNTNKISTNTSLDLIVQGGDWNKKTFNNFSSQLQNRINIKIIKSNKSQTS